MVETAPDAAFAFGDDSTLIWDGVPIARLKRGTSALRPRVQMLDSEFLDGAQRERLRIRLQRFVDDRVRARSGAAARRWPAGAGRSRNSAACCIG